MEKEALIDIILNDLKEVHTLVNTFKGKSEINTAFVNLTRTKIANINEELSLLEQLNGQKTSVSSSESSLTSETTSNSTKNDIESIAESSKQFIKGEANTKGETDEQVAKTNEESEQVIKKVPATIETSVQENKKSVNIIKKELQSIEKQNSPSIKQQPVNEKLNQKTDHTPNKATVLGESIKQDTSSVNEAIATSKDITANIKQIGKPVNDVRKAIGLNDRFYFQRELFGNNANLFNQTLDQINQMDSFNSAISFLQSNFNWETDNEVTVSFFNSIQRRFL